MNLIIDIGNTRGKAAVFEHGSLKKVVVFDKSEIVLEVKKIIKEQTILGGIISSVSNISEIKREKLLNLLPFVELSHQTKLPFKNKYKTPKTLGADRIALVAAAVQQYPKKNVLIIDAGTCITFDFVNAKKEYLGGAISLGVEMRYKSLHQFTSKLPLLSAVSPASFLGNSTEECIHSGVVNGVANEIDGIINQYKSKYLDLTVVLTGGDVYFLSKQLKSSIFANPNFVLEGLHTILIHNKTNDK